MLSVNCTLLNLHYVFFMNLFTFYLCVILMKEHYNKVFLTPFLKILLIIFLLDEHSPIKT